MENKPKTTKVNIDDMQALIARSVLIATKENELTFLKNENKTYWQSLAKKYNLNPKLTYDVDQANCILTWKEDKDG